MRLIVGSIPSDSDNEISAIELLKQAGFEEGLEQIRERARAEVREDGALQAKQPIAIKIVAARFPDRRTSSCCCGFWQQKNRVALAAVFGLPA